VAKLINLSIKVNGGRGKFMGIFFPSTPLTGDEFRYSLFSLLVPVSVVSKGLQ